jgi:hypothetical protein
LWGHWPFLKKILGLVLAWKSGLEVPLLPLGPYCHLQTILLSDLAGYDSPLQIFMAIGTLFQKTVLLSTVHSQKQQLQQQQLQQQQLQQ